MLRWWEIGSVIGVYRRVSAVASNAYITGNQKKPRRRRGFRGSYFRESRFFFGLHLLLALEVPHVGEEADDGPQEKDKEQRYVQHRHALLQGCVCSILHA